MNLTGLETVVRHDYVMKARGTAFAKSACGKRIAPVSLTSEQQREVPTTCSDCLNKSKEHHYYV